MSSQDFSLSLQSSKICIGVCCRTLYSLSRQHRRCSAPTSTLQDAGAGNDSTRASAALTSGYKVRVPRPSLPLLPLTLHLNAARPPCLSPRSPPSRSPAIAYAAVHTHAAAHRTHADSAQSLHARSSPSLHPLRLHPHPPHPPSLNLPSSFPALAYTVAPCPHRRGERRHQTRARVTQLRHGSSPRAPPRLHPHPHRLSLVPRHTRPRTAASTGAGATHVHVARDRAPTLVSFIRRSASPSSRNVRPLPSSSPPSIPFPSLSPYRTACPSLRHQTCAPGNAPVRVRAESPRARPEFRADSASCKLGARARGAAV
ncbi:hypothetical protein B0H16DRAFT_1899678 [Mycena metata]|uniref:Uncharacterized protein n=1 Tax=Mycena metata TaxID=1033252 RepID=A0AAD7MEA2_9AGAR|nr:hypothetical protein B0H16DRAFT_1899678 [Mycena metata]